MRRVTIEQIAKNLGLRRLSVQQTFARVTRASVDTVEIVRGLPTLAIVGSRTDGTADTREGH